jgi:radical SAM superfamily enzyme YgiQ (UPF0313 family)
MFSLMKNANITSVNIGLESGSERTRKEILRRNYSNEDFFQAIEAARKNDLEVNVYLMVGLPGEDRVEFQKTVECLKRAQPKRLVASIFFPYPGTDIYQYCLEHKLLPLRMDTRSERFRASLNMPGFSRSQIQWEYFLLNYKVYKNTLSIRVIFYDTKLLILRSSVMIKYLYYNYYVKIKDGLRFLKRNMDKCLRQIKGLF